VCEVIRDAVAMHGKFKPSEEDASKRLVEQFTAWLTTDVAKPLDTKGLLLKQPIMKATAAKSAPKTLDVKELRTESVPLIGAPFKGEIGKSRRIRSK